MVLWFPTVFKMNLHHNTMMDYISVFQLIALNWVQLVGIQIYNLDIARIKNQRNETMMDADLAISHPKEILKWQVCQNFIVFRLPLWAGVSQDPEDEREVARMVGEGNYTAHVTCHL